MTVFPPPALSSLPYGTKLIVGMGESMIIGDFDFETYSEAGFIWNPQKQAYDAPPNATVKGLPSIGAAVYSEHPSTEVLCLAYDLKDGKGKRTWTPWDEPPQDLFDHIANGLLLEAWNCAFERWIWTNVCVPRYGWPPLPFECLRDAMAKSRAFALPGRLKNAGEVLKIENQKLDIGKRLIMKYSCPRKPTKNNPARRLYLGDYPKDAADMYEYNRMDIVAEAEISCRLPDLSPDELEFWQYDQRINIRGVQLDREMILKSINIIEQAYRRYNPELIRLTGGLVKKASEVQKLRAYLATRGYDLPNLDSDTVEKLLQSNVEPDIKRVLEIREMLSSAAVKKLYAMLNQMTSAGRAHDLFLYHSARTGRAAGAAIQPQNMPNSGNPVSLCIKCSKHFNHLSHACPWCGCYSTRDHIEWNSQAVNEAIETIATGSLDCVEYFFGNAISTISGCLRGMFISAPGHDLICSDYSAIEAVVLAMLSGEQWRIDVFKTHGKIYETSASKITGIPLESYLAHKKETGTHHIDRKIGKVAELACFSPDTQVLTHRGYVGIKDVLLTDKLWDGFKWVSHQGVIYKGKRKTIKLDGVKMTPTHPINCGDSWKRASLLASNAGILARALEIGSANLPLLNALHPIKSRCNVLAGVPLILFNLVTYVGKNLLGAIFALKRNLKKRILNCIQNMQTSFRVLNIGVGLSIDYVRQLPVALQRTINSMLVMVDEEYPFVNYGYKNLRNSYDTLYRFPVGMFPLSKWIESTLTKVTNRVISVLFPVKKILSIKEKLTIWKKKYDYLSPVYDIVNAGDLHQFTIKTDSGHLIVHNSGYQGWIGAWKAFGADKFMSEEQIKDAILAWRIASPNVVEFWGGQQRYRVTEYYGLEGMAVLAILNPGDEFTHRGITYVMKGNVLYCRLLSGRYLVYHNARLTMSDRRPGTYTINFETWNTNPKYGAPGWITSQTYGGKLTENVVQATARDILAHAIVNLEKAGYPVVLHVHDEIVAEVPEGYGTVEEFERIMSSLPSWANDWPVKASGGWRAKRYGK